MDRIKIIEEVINVMWNYKNFADMRNVNKIDIEHHLLLDLVHVEAAIELLIDAVLHELERDDDESDAEFEDRVVTRCREVIQVNKISGIVGSALDRNSGKIRNLVKTLKLREKILDILRKDSAFKEDMLDIVFNT